MRKEGDDDEARRGDIRVRASDSDKGNDKGRAWKNTTPQKSIAGEDTNPQPDSVD